ncbi:MAG: hypothetical protein NVSMB27_03590 [Ktedonobacteraceae bacterium]
MTFGLGLATAIVIGLTLLVMIGHGRNVATASGGGSNAPVGYGSLNHPKGPCANAGQAPCTAPDPGWFTVTVERPEALTAAIASREEFRTMQAHYGYVAMDTPTLVRTYNMHTGNSYYDDDHYVVTVRDASGMRNGIFDFVYDRVNQRMRFSSYGVITAADPHSHLAFPFTSSTVAISQLQSKRGLNVKVGTQPELFFFPIDPSFPILNSPMHNWTGGGNSAMNPMWHLVGADGQDYYIGVDLSVHVRGDLPIAPGQP